MAPISKRETQTPRVHRSRSPLRMGCLKASGGNAGKGGGKSKSKATGGDKIEKRQQLQTDREHLVTLRKALFTDEGKNKNVLQDFAPFAKYERNGINIAIQFATGSSADRAELKKAVELIRTSDAKVRAHARRHGSRSTARGRPCTTTRKTKTIFSPAFAGRR